MARPCKQGLDYFPLDVHVDEKIKFIKARFRWEGFGILIGLYQHIYSVGYWCSWTEDDAFLYAEENRVEYDLLSSIINEALKRKLFCPCLYEKYNILTSNGIQKRYIEIVKRRKNVEVVEEYKLIRGAWGKHDADTMTASRTHDADINSVNDGINPVNTSKSTQTERKQKGKETETESSGVRKPPEQIQSPSEFISGEEDAAVQDAMKDCLNILGLSELQVIRFWGTHHEHERFVEAVQCAVEKQKKSGTLDSPYGFLATVYQDGAISRRTRDGKGRKEEDGLDDRLLEILTEAVAQPNQEAMWAYLKGKDKKLFGVADSTSPFLFRNKQDDFRIILGEYQGREK